MFRPKGIAVVDWFGILPQIVALVGDVIKALRADSDGGKKVTEAEIAKIGADLVAIVSAVA